MDETAQEQQAISVKTVGRPFPKGVSGNPGGRPIGSISIVNIIKKKLEEIPDGQKHTYGEILVKKILHKCLQEGDTSMIKDVINRVDGMPLQKNETDLTSKGQQLGVVVLPSLNE